MCTAITYKTKDFYFGRNLDLEYHYREEVAITPRRYPLKMRNGNVFENHFAIIGIATISGEYPLYYDATNEKGLSGAALNFPDNAVYFCKQGNKNNIASFELIPYLLAKCETVQNVVNELQNINIWNVSFSYEFPLSPLHWMFADENRAIVVESVCNGLKIHENPVGVLTNNPPFEFHMHNLPNYINLTAEPPKNRFSSKINIAPYGVGMGAIGLPGDLSSASRFIRASFVKFNSVSGTGEEESVRCFFHILKSVEQQRGVNIVRPGEYEHTIYSSCCNASKGIYYYTSYDNEQITLVDMNKENLNSDKIISYPLLCEGKIFAQN